MDSFFVWNGEKASQISKTSINTVVKSLKDLALGSRVNGLGICLFICISLLNMFYLFFFIIKVIAFDDNVVKSEEMTRDFFKVSISKRIIILN